MDDQSIRAKALECAVLFCVAVARDENRRFDKTNEPEVYAQAQKFESYIKTGNL